MHFHCAPQLLILLLLGIAVTGEGKFEDCGVFVFRLARDCASVKYSTRLFCCNSLRAWNDALCWCDRNANEAAKTLAGNDYGFQFRSIACNIQNVYKGTVRLPNSSGTVIKSSCPNATHIINGTEKFERLDSILKFLGESVTATTKVMLELVNESVEWNDIGLGNGSGVSELKEIIHFRYLTGSWYSHDAAQLLKNSLIWRDKNTVSYEVVIRRGEYRWRQFHFVKFVESDIDKRRIGRLTIMDVEIGRWFQQFVTMTVAMRTSWTVIRTSAVHACYEINEQCIGYAVYETFEQCVEHFLRLKSERRVACMKLGRQSSLNLIQGNTITCRWFYLTIAAVADENDDGKLMSRRSLCNMVGVEGVGQCAEERCDSSGYDDFVDVRQRRDIDAAFEESSGFVCSSTNCEEEMNWSHY